MWFYAIYDIWFLTKLFFFCFIWFIKFLHTDILLLSLQNQANFEAFLDLYKIQFNNFCLTYEINLIFGINMALSHNCVHMLWDNNVCVCFSFVFEFIWFATNKLCSFTFSAILLLFYFYFMRLISNLAKVSFLLFEPVRKF